ncbi:hypothetical protein FD754_023950 [Muntiacus muntjak]|uniref:Uncharacterized protein n=1 Tax=Muntiacus muntjak TaxID=9888 RepID=A0A5N3URH8_MUNMU|nr:hypothetical protein FD754_023951 [Muntiacus muntjak]KAB0339370.1 hypothetical protein FD754_023950 [Muntiacus muntjak]
MDISLILICHEIKQSLSKKEEIKKNCTKKIFTTQIITMVKIYHGYICQYKDVLKQYQLKYSETPLSHEYYEKKREYEEIQNRVLACTEQLKMNENIFMEFLVPAPFPSLTSWTLHMVNLRYKTQDILKHANQFSKRSCDLKKEIDDMEIEINYLNQQIARHYEMKNLPETLEEKNKNVEKRKELKERIFEKDPQPVLMLNKTPQNSQLFLPYESQKLVKPIKMHSSEPRVMDKKEESSVRQSKLANVDFKQKENDACYWHFSFNISPSNEHPGLISFRMDWLDLLAIQGTLKRYYKPRPVKCSQISPQREIILYCGDANKDHGIWSHHFMANIWGNSGNSERLYFLGPRIIADGDCIHKIKRYFLLRIKAMTNLDTTEQQQQKQNKNDRIKTNDFLPRERKGHSKHPLPTTQEKILHMDITRWSKRSEKQRRKGKIYPFECRVPKNSKER